MFNRYAYAFNDPINMIDPDGKCSTNADGMRVGVCPNDATAEGLINEVNSVEGYTELSDLDAQLTADGKRIDVNGVPGSNDGSFSVPAANIPSIGDRFSNASVGDGTKPVEGVDGNGGPETDNMTGAERLVHEVVGHGGAWASQGATNYMATPSTAIGPNSLGVDESTSQREAGPIAAGNRFRAATGKSFQRTNHLQAVVATGQKR